MDGVLRALDIGGVGWKTYGEVSHKVPLPVSLQTGAPSPDDPEIDPTRSPSLPDCQTIGFDVTREAQPTKQGKESSRKGAEVLAGHCLLQGDRRNNMRTN